MNQYITGLENENGYIWVMGDSKSLEACKKLARRHNQKIFKLIEVTDYTKEQ